MKLNSRSSSEEDKNSFNLLVAYHEDFQTKEAILLTYLIGIFIGAHFFTSLFVMFESVCMFFIKLLKINELVVL